jgi:hypothetical protein
VPEGATFAPKQLQLDKKHRKLYWSDREGMRVMRVNLDCSNIEMLVDTSKGDTRPGHDQKKRCVGIAVDPERRQLYWTHKGGMTRAWGASAAPISNFPGDRAPQSD